MRTMCRARFIVVLLGVCPKISDSNQWILQDTLYSATASSSTSCVTRPRWEEETRRRRGVDKAMPADVVGDVPHRGGAPELGSGLSYRSGNVRSDLISLASADDDPELASSSSTVSRRGQRAHRSSTSIPINCYHRYSAFRPMHNFRVCINTYGLYRDTRHKSQQATFYKTTNPSFTASTYHN